MKLHSHSEVKRVMALGLEVYALRPNARIITKKQVEYYLNLHGLQGDVEAFLLDLFSQEQPEELK